MLRALRFVGMVVLAMAALQIAIIGYMFFEKATGPFTALMVLLVLVLVTSSVYFTRFKRNRLRRHSMNATSSK